MRLSRGKKKKEKGTSRKRRPSPGLGIWLEARVPGIFFSLACAPRLALVPSLRFERFLSPIHGMYATHVPWRPLKLKCFSLNTLWVDHALGLLAS